MLKITTLAVTLGLALTAPAFAQNVDQNPEAAGVRAALDHYIAGHATGSGAEFREAFHDEAKLFWMRDGKFMQRTDDEYIAGASGKPPADEAQRKRSVEILDITGDVAVAKVVLDGHVRRLHVAPEDRERVEDRQQDLQRPAQGQVLEFTRHGAA
jgi:hypothetical protein